MWDYDKLFTDGNIIGIKNCYRNKVFNNVVDVTINTSWLEGYKNDELCCKDQYVDADEIIKHSYTTNFEIQYIIRLDEHGNVAEKLFDRNVDMPKPMPELETGMFVRINSYMGSRLGFVDAENNHIIYQESYYDCIDGENGIADKIVEVYGKNTCAFAFCDKEHKIWSKLNSN